MTATPEVTAATLDDLSGEHEGSGSGSGKRTEIIAITALLLSTSALYLFGLTVSGWGNTYYAAAAQAGADNWTAFFFGASDPQASITVDKPPASIWLMALSVRLLGLSSFSVLLPQALLGIGTVAVVYATVRAVRPMPTALLAGSIMATTPIAALVFRYNNPDALLTLLIALAGYFCVRHLARGGLAWAAAMGAAVGLAFLTKQLQAFLVVPGLALAVLAAGSASRRRRLSALVIAAAGCVLAAGWWIVAVTAIPPSARPFIGGSPTNSFLELTFGYNGVQRITGSNGNGLLAFGAGVSRLFTGAIGWLLPAAIILGVVGLVLVWARRRTDPAAGVLILGLGSIAVTGAAISLMSGIYHSYYTVAMAPAIAITAAVGASEAWRQRQAGPVRASLLIAVGITTVVAVSLLRSQPFAAALVGILGGCAIAGLVLSRAPFPLRRIAAVAAVVAALTGPMIYSIETASAAHGGSGPTAGPGDSHQSTRALPRELVDVLRSGDSASEWAAATIGSRAAAQLQLGSGVGVMPIGGYKRKDPAPTLEQFAALVADHRIRWFIDSGGAVSGEAARIRTWVLAAFPRVTVGGARLYDLFAPPLLSADSAPSGQQNSTASSTIGWPSSATGSRVRS